MSVLYFNLYYDKTNITAYDDLHSSDVSNFEINNFYWIQQSTNVYRSFRMSYSCRTVALWKKNCWQTGLSTKISPESYISAARCLSLTNKIWITKMYIQQAHSLLSVKQIAAYTALSNYNLHVTMEIKVWWSIFYTVNIYRYVLISYFFKKILWQSPANVRSIRQGMEQGCPYCFLIFQ